MAVLIGGGSSSTMPKDGSVVSGTGGAASGGGGGGGSLGVGGSNGAGGSTGASGTTTITSCDVNSAGAHTCIEYAVGYTPNVPAGCNVLHGTYATAGCDHPSSSGGCRQTVATIGTMTTYFYPPIMPADVMVQCTNDGNATYVAP